MSTWSLKPRERDLAASEFYCPNCYTRRTYDIKPLSEVGVFCLIPLFETKEMTHIVECQTCKNGFDPEILKHNNQILFKLVAATRTELMGGISPGSLKIKLMNDGLKEEVINKLISLAQN